MSNSKQEIDDELINSLIFNGFNPEPNPEHRARLNELFQKLAPTVVQEVRQPNICAYVGPALLTWLLNSGSKWPWFNHLTLVGMIYAATGVVHQTGPALGVHTFLKWAIPDYYPDLAQLKVEAAITKCFGSDLAARGANAYHNYSALQQPVKAYVDTLPEARQVALVPFLLPVFTPSRKLYLLKKAATEKAKQKRKEQVFPVARRLPGLIALARRRCRWLQQLEAEVQQIAAKVAAGEITLPTTLAVKHWDGQQSMSFKIWNQPSWILAHTTYYHPERVLKAKKDPESFDEQLFLQLWSDLLDDCWFLQAVSLGIIPGEQDLSPQAQAYLDHWNMPRFYALAPGLLQLSRSASTFLSAIRQKKIDWDDDQPLFCVEPLLAAALVGLFVLVSITTTGMRIGELQQVTLSSECMVRSHLPQYDDDQGQWQLGPERIFWSVFPKGESQSRPYLVSSTMLETMFALHDLHERYYGSGSIGPVPARPGVSLFSHYQKYPGRHAFVLQWAGRQLSSRVLPLCLTFLLLEHDFRDLSGRPVRITPHTLRHSIATWLRLQGLPLQDIMTFLGHINLTVSDYYSQLPADELFKKLGPALTALAQLTGTDPAAIRTVEQLGQLQVEALKQYGSLRKTVGGDCGTLHPCEVQFQCAGCPYFVPDPIRRNEIEQRISNLTTAIAFFENSGQPLAAETAMGQRHNWIRVLAEVDAGANVPLLAPASVALRCKKLEFAEAEFMPLLPIKPLALPPHHD
ncbi:MAG: site-specific integrase [Chloroflexi bacterium]|nr:site-specific integrase [Chloroflexota bacterium]